MNSRRSFVLGAAGAVALMAGKASANSRVRVAVLGVNGRGTDHIRGFNALPNAEVVMLCDPDRNLLAERAEQFETKLMAIATSHAEATYAPMRVHLVRIARPTIISMTPTMCMKVCPLNGNILRASGLMYPVQLAKRLKYLSRPASNGPTPSPIRSTHQPWSNRESNPLFMFACLQENRVGRSE